MIGVDISNNGVLQLVVAKVVGLLFCVIALGGHASGHTDR